jgi:hypothetical protein
MILGLGAGYVLSELAKKLPPGTFLGIVRRPEAITPLKEAGQDGVACFLPSYLDFKGKRLKELYKDQSIIIDSTPPPKFIPTQIAEEVINTVIDKDAVTIIYLSSTSVFGFEDGREVFDDTPPSPASNAGRARLMVENLYRRHFKNVCALRISGIYGPGRGMGLALREGRYQVRSDLDRYTNRVHRDDIVELLLKLIFSPLQGHNSINVSDDKPMLTSEVLALYKEKFGYEATPSDLPPSDRLREHKQIKNIRMKELLGGGLKFPSLVEGIGEEFK